LSFDDTRTLITCFDDASGNVSSIAGLDELADILDLSGEYRECYARFKQLSMIIDEVDVLKKSRFDSPHGGQQIVLRNR
jgi:hypothetical protein